MPSVENPRWFSFPNIGVITDSGKMWLYVHFYFLKKSYYFTPLGRWEY